MEPKPAKRPRGRPCLFDVPVVTVAIPIPPTWAAEVAAMAREGRMTRAALYREIIGGWIAEHPRRGTPEREKDTIGGTVA